LGEHRVRRLCAASTVVACAVAVTGCSGSDDRVAPAPTPASSVGGPTPTLSSEAPAVGNYDPPRFAGPVVTHAQAAGINPVLLMAVLYNESYKPHDPELERAWQKVDPDAAFGVANMHRAAFDDTKRGREFANRRWEELPDDPDLAIQAAAWYLRDLAAHLPVSPSGPYTGDELLALGYNAGPSAMRSAARGAAPGTQAKAYVDRLRDNWPAAETAVRGGG
jgi:soluble lytic murein transglycosylase-like protein